MVPVGIESGDLYHYKTDCTIKKNSPQFEIQSVNFCHKNQALLLMQKKNK